ncbi:MAG: putative toxin-antitoxin system toxin component, PIN family [Neisseriaceae bacterium]|nr:putative toxin-antitoxin system toxin component, PIN family [Neisseriaceae bacterium]
MPQLVLIDTNILFSALIFENSLPYKVLKHILHNNNAAFCEPVIREIFTIIQRKAPKYQPYIEDFFKNEQYIFLSSKKHNHAVKTPIRDIKDQAILNIAINANVDIILTGDKDFLSLNIDKPKIMTARDYFEKFMEK